MSVGALDRAATQPPLTRLGLEELDPVQPDRRRQELARINAPPKSLPRQSLHRFSTHSQAVTDLTPCPRRWPLCSHPALGGRRAVAHLARTTVGICNSGQDCALEDATAGDRGRTALSQDRAHKCHCRRSRASKTRPKLLSEVLCVPLHPGQMKSVR